MRHTYARDAESYPTMSDSRSAPRSLAWHSPDKRVVCTVVPQLSDYQLVLTIDNRVSSRQVFAKWADAVDEATRLRGIHVDSA